MAECIKDAGEFAKSKRIEADQQILAEFERDGVEIIQLDPETMAEFQKKVEPIYTELMSLWTEEIYSDFMAAINSNRQAD